MFSVSLAFPSTRVTSVVSLPKDEAIKKTLIAFNILLVDQQRERETLLYTVDHQYEPYWTNAKTNNHICIMPAFDTNDASINPNRFADKLVGAMCEITFTLRHYAIAAHTKPDGRKVDANDVFSAKVEAVTVLKNPPVVVRSPYRGQTRRPQHRPQLPTRREQVNAAVAFVPQPDFGRAFTGSSTTVPPLNIKPNPAMIPSNVASPISAAAITSLANADIASPSVTTFTAPIHTNPMAVESGIKVIADAGNPDPTEAIGDRIKPKGNSPTISM